MPVFRNKLAHAPETSTAGASGSAPLSAPSQTISFAPNVTPTTYPLEQSETWNDEDDADESAQHQAEPSPFSDFFTPTLPRPNTDPHTRRMSEDHIPRPPNAFILFRSDLVHRKAVPSSIESDHGSISKIIGHCWRTLPPRQKKIWEKKAQEAKAAHKAMYPNYRYSPVHRKDGAPKRKVKKEILKDERRCEDVARLLMSGAKGEELETKVRELDAQRPPMKREASEMPSPLSGSMMMPPPSAPAYTAEDYMHMPPPGARMYRRSSSAPLPGATFDGYEQPPSPVGSPIMLPTLPPPSLPASPGLRFGRLPRSSGLSHHHTRSTSVTPASRKARAANSKRPKDQLYLSSAHPDAYNGLPGVNRVYHHDQGYEPPQLHEQSYGNTFQNYRFPAPTEYNDAPLAVGTSFNYFDPVTPGQPESSLFANVIDPSICLSSSPSSPSAFPHPVESPFAAPASPFSQSQISEPSRTSSPFSPSHVAPSSAPGPSPLSAVTSSLHGYGAQQQPSFHQPHPQYAFMPHLQAHQPEENLSEQFAHFELSSSAPSSHHSGSSSDRSVGTSSGLSSPHSQPGLEWDPTTPTQSDVYCEPQQQCGAQDIYAPQVAAATSPFELAAHSSPLHAMALSAQQQQQQGGSPLDLHADSFTASLFQAAGPDENDLAAYNAGMMHIEGFQLHDLIQPSATGAY